MRRHIEFTDKAVEGLESLTAVIRERIFKKCSWVKKNFFDMIKQSLI